MFCACVDETMRAIFGNENANSRGFDIAKPADGSIELGGRVQSPVPNTNYCMISTICFKKANLNLPKLCSRLILKQWLYVFLPFMLLEAFGPKVRALFQTSKPRWTYWKKAPKPRILAFNFLALT